MGQSFHGFHGQRVVVNDLKGQLRGSQSLGEPMPHILLIGPSGMGKTHLAKALAEEAGANLRVVHGHAKQKHLCEEFVQLAKGDFILLDEAHTFPRESQEYLYEIMDSSIATNKMSNTFEQAFGPFNKDPKTGKLFIAPCTIMFATNQPSFLLEALTRRLEITILLNDYSAEEMIDIVSAHASKVNLLFSEDALKWVSRASQGQPRRVHHIVQGMHRLFHGLKKQLERKHVIKYLKSTGRDARGLDREQQAYLLQLYKLGRASIQTLSSMLGLEKQFVEEKIEPGLIKMGMVTKGIQGRELTKHVGERWVADLQERKKEAKEKKKTLDEVRLANQNPSSMEIPATSNIDDELLKILSTPGSTLSQSERKDSEENLRKTLGTAVSAEAERFFNRKENEQMPSQPS